LAPARQRLILTLSVVAVALVGAVAWIAHHEGWWLDAVGQWVAGCTPFMGFPRLLDPEQPWTGVVVLPLTVALAQVVFLVAVRGFPADRLDDAMPYAPAHAVSPEAAQGNDGPWPERSPATRPGPGLAAITWREFHGPLWGRHSPWASVVAALAVTSALRAGAVWLDPEQAYFAWWTTTLAVVAALAAGIWIYTSHGAMLGAELRTGTADLLFTLPWSRADILGAKRRALAWAAAPIVGTAAVAGLAMPWGDLPIAGEAVGLLILVLVAGVVALAQATLLMSVLIPKSAVAYSMLIIYAVGIGAFILNVRGVSLVSDLVLAPALAGLVVADIALQVAVAAALRRLST
jgi:hypothetical protein